MVHTTAEHIKWVFLACNFENKGWKVTKRNSFQKSRKLHTNVCMPPPPTIPNHLTLACNLPDFWHDNHRLRVVSNFGNGDCGAGKIHTRVRAKFRGDATRRESRKLPSRCVASKFRACVCISRAPQSPLPKLETTRSLSMTPTARTPCSGLFLPTWLCITDNNQVNMQTFS